MRQSLHEGRAADPIKANGSSDPVRRSPQLDEPVEDEEDETAEEQHVAEQFGLAASRQLLDAADGGAQQAAGGVKVRVLKRRFTIIITGEPGLLLSPIVHGCY